ncbi:MAG: UDP-N-acetylmuramoyl-L-alanyl-D-glutamate--2,6-diaminopimelate ligase [Candidatus Omnitrophica bacterium]|nr:UDP-N-acetylmuramoyl-L-alanyl-D-glutamate--2,6-diaminopimelate ligase [Candidatus Omnitrophota bacterium]
MASVMTLSELLAGLTARVVPSVVVTGITAHSKQVRPGDVFVATRGAVQDGHQFIEEAVARGAAAVVVERLIACRVGCPVVLLENAKQLVPTLAARFYGEPARRLRVIGVTGTNGKTTTTYLIRSMLEAAGHRVGLLGTVAYEIGQRHLPSVNTTPGALELQGFLAQMVEQGIEWCVMEVSSHALDQGRIEGVHLHGAVWTCLASDHLDYHGTVEQYAAAKRRIFTYLHPEGVAVLNADDPYTATLATDLAHRAVVTFGLERAADVSARLVQCTWQGTSLVFNSPWGVLRLSTPLVGRHNVLNVAAASAAALSMGVPAGAIERAMSDVPQVPGRMERIPNDLGIMAVIDYAHTAEAMRLVLLSLRELVRGRLIVVFGCGGDRDQTKRPAMGQIASLLADYIVLTSDNPRSENPLDIIHQIKAGFMPGFQGYQVVVDREQAIRQALAMARPDDAVLIAGKGHEAYQIFDHVTVPFSDHDVIERHFARAKVAVVSP